MKPGLLFLTVLLLAGLVLGSQRVCKTQILRAFGLHSRVTAKQGNSLCPKVSYNCCTRHDQMKIHKLWDQSYKSGLTGTYTRNLDAFLGLAGILKEKGQFAIKEIVQKFQAFAKPPEAFMNHLISVSGEFDKRSAAFYDGKMKELKGKITQMNRELMRYRQGFLCNLCNWRNHRFYNPQSMTVTYNQKFCLELALKYIDTLWDKYGEVFRFINVMDELYLLFSGKRMIDPIDHAIFHRYAIIIDKCKKDTSKIENCADVCREFNLNKFNYMWDGEAPVIVKFTKAYEEFQKLSDERGMLTVFQYRKDQWSKSQLSKFIRDESVLSTKAMDPPGSKDLKKNSFDLEFKSNASKNFLEYTHPTNSVQIEMLDEELSSYALYRMIDPPVDVSKFLIIFDPNTGINLKKDSEEMNFDVSVDQILALLNASGGNVKALNEIIDDPVKALLKSIQIVDIADFLNDPFIEFAKVVKPPPKKPVNERGLSAAGRLVAGLLTALLLLASAL